MAPAGMEGNIEGRIGPDRRHHFVGRRIETAEIDREMVQASLDTVFEQTVGALAAAAVEGRGRPAVGVVGQALRNATHVLRRKAGRMTAARPPLRGGRLPGKARQASELLQAPPLDAPRADASGAPSGV